MTSNALTGASSSYLIPLAKVLIREHRIDICSGANIEPILNYGLVATVVDFALPRSNIVGL